MKAIVVLLIVITVSTVNGQAQSFESSARPVLPFVIPALSTLNLGQATTTAQATPTQAPAAQATPAQAPAATAESQTPEALARKYIELWNTGTQDQINLFPPFVMNSVGARVVVNSGMLKSVIANWRKSMPDLNFEIKDTIVQGEKVAMRVVFTGTYESHLFPFTADPKSVGPNRRIKATDLLMFQVKDGKVVEIWEQYNVAGVQIQMGGKWCTDVVSSAAPAIGSSPPVPKSDNPPSSPKP